MDKLDLVVSAIEQGSFYSHNGNMEEAKKYYVSALNMMEEMGYEESREYGEILMGYGEIYMMNNEYEEALTLLKRSKMILENSEGETVQSVAKACNCIGSIYMQLGMTEKAEAPLKQSLKLLEGSLIYQDEKAAAHVGLGMYYKVQNRLRDAKKHILKAIDIFEETEAVDIHYSSAKATLGELLYEEKDYIGAAAAYEKAAEVLKSIYGICPPYEVVMNNLKKVKEKLQ